MTQRVVALNKTFHSKFLIHGNAAIFCFAAKGFGLQ
jgi:hypothetical protein